MHEIIAIIRNAIHVHGVADDSYDFVHSSHCLEHMRSPSRALTTGYVSANPVAIWSLWFPMRTCTSNPFGPRPSNAHKWSFTIGKASSWSPQSIDIKIMKTVVDRVASEDGAPGYQLPVQERSGLIRP